MAVPRRKHIKVVHKKLPHDWGFALCGDDIIEVDIRALGKKHLEICIHEALHLMFPEDEDNIVKKSITITNMLWKLNYRRVDNTNNEPLQDGKK